eukprot:scaffold242515_cov27-Tisochrysis_lutea.AAC.1
MVPQPQTRIINERFEVIFDNVVGRGGFGVVFRARDIVAVPTLEVAAKRGTRESLRNEAHILMKVGNHSSIIHLHDYVELADDAWMFIDYVGGGELFDRLIDSGHLSENAARPIARNIASALAHCLKKGIVHRDIKLENVMLCVEDPQALKLIDFGLAVALKLAPDGSIAPHRLYDGVGSRSWKAPELFLAASAGYQAPPVDAWAYGVLVFSLLSGFFPFDEARSTDWRFQRLAEDQARGIGACESIFNMYDRPCPFSRRCKDFLNGLLTIDPALRTSIPYAYDHVWLQVLDIPPLAAAVDGVVYRSSADGCWDDTDEPLTMQPPDNAPRLTRQAAAIDVAVAP